MFADEAILGLQVSLADGFFVQHTPKQGRREEGRQAAAQVLTGYATLGRVGGMELMHGLQSLQTQGVKEVPVQGQIAGADGTEFGQGRGDLFGRQGQVNGEAGNVLPGLTRLKQLLADFAGGIAAR